MSENVLLPQPAQKALEMLPIVINDTRDYGSRLGVAWAPGRVNLIGEHTDYNDGFVLPLAVNRVVAFAARERQDSTVRIWSSNFQEYAQFSLDGLPFTFEQQKEVLPSWALYIMAVVSELMHSGVTLSGFDAVVDGDVPIGGGMSSSAALEIATTQACALFSSRQLTSDDQEERLKPIELAALCQQAEHLASGVRSGILDQAASCLGQPGKAILLDCRSLEYRYLPFDTQDLSLLVIDTGVRRELATTAYNERRSQCEEAVRILSKIIKQNEPGNQPMHTIIALRDITKEQFERFGSQLPVVLQRRAGFVIAENARVLEAAKLLELGLIEEVGPLLWASHAGLRNDYEVSCFELDTLVEIARQVSGVLGARMQGGGFGGCTINLVRHDAVESLKEIVDKEYLAQTGLRASVEICKAAGGPGMRWVN
jgi:galactokinase